MKVGDTVRISDDECSIQQFWVISAIRTDARGFWIQIDDARYEQDVWHDASFFEITHEALK